MSNKTYLLLNNKLMELFLINCGLLDIRNDKNDSYDILFCDSLELYNNNKINANKKVYLACWLLESLDDISNYNDFQYYIGFGQDFYDKLKENTGFECSRVLDGFIFDNNININKGQVLILSSNIEYNIFKDYIIFLFLSYLYISQKFFNKNYNIYTNIKINKDIDNNVVARSFRKEYESLYDKIKIIQDSSINEFILSSEIIYSLDINNYINIIPIIREKTIICWHKVSYILNNFNINPLNTKNDLIEIFKAGYITLYEKASLVYNLSLMNYYYNKSIYFTPFSYSKNGLDENLLSFLKNNNISKSFNNSLCNDFKNVIYNIKYR